MKCSYPPPKCVHTIAIGDDIYLPNLFIYQEKVNQCELYYRSDVRCDYNTNPVYDILNMQYLLYSVSVSAYFHGILYHIENFSNREILDNCQTDAENKTPLLPNTFFWFMHTFRYHCRWWKGTAYYIRLSPTGRHRQAATPNVSSERK